MIASLHGTILEKTPGYVVIECGGVGYEASIPLGTYNDLPSVGSECRLCRISGPSVKCAAKRRRSKAVYIPSPHRSNDARQYISGAGGSHAVVPVDIDHHISPG